MTADNGLRTWAELRRSAPWRTIALLLIVVLATCLFFFGIANQVRDEEKSAIALQALRAEIATAQSSVRGYTLVEGHDSWSHTARPCPPWTERLTT